MAKAIRDLPRYQGWWLAGGCVAFLTAVTAAALITAAMTAVQESRERQVAQQRTEPRPPSELLRVPEVRLLPAQGNHAAARQELVQVFQKVRTQEQADADGFVKNLLATRTDMKGMPFLMGGMCRMDNTTSGLFGAAVGTTHDALQEETNSTFRSVDSVDVFWTRWGGQDTSVGVAALTQIYGPQTVTRRESLAKHLQAIDHPASTKALARAAVYDFDHHVRLAAVDGLAKRSKQDYTDVLLAGLHHPWVMASQNAARAIARLNRQDLVPQLVAFLAEPDPREPFDQDCNGKQCAVVREVVKINHHRNCVLCHAAAPANTMPSGVFAVMPTPGEPFPTPMPGSPYGSMPSELMIRADVTYLRQDFSVLQPVEGASPWPEMQRFDFFVRTRELTAEEVAEHNKQKAGGAATLSAHHKAAIGALERLTGRQDVEPTAAAWAAAVNIPVPQAVVRQ